MTHRLYYSINQTNLELGMEQQLKDIYNMDYSEELYYL